MDKKTEKFRISPCACWIFWRQTFTPFAQTAIYLATFFLILFSLHLLGDFPHLCQLLLQLYISMKSQTCLWHNKSTATRFWCSTCNVLFVLSPVCTVFQSESLLLGSMEGAKEKKRLKVSWKGQHEVSLQYAFLCPRCTSGLFASVLCIWQLLSRNKTGLEWGGTKISATLFMWGLNILFKKN